MQYSDREQDIISCLLYLKSSKAIGIILKISHRTVDNFVRQIMIKVKIHSRDKLILFFQHDKNFFQLQERYYTLITNYYFNIITSKLKIIKALNIFLLDTENNKDEINDFIKLLASIELEYNIVKDINERQRNNYQLIFISENNVTELDVNNIQFQNKNSNLRVFASFNKTLTNIKNTLFYPLGIKKFYLLNILKILNHFSSYKIDDDIKKFVNLTNNLFKCNDIHAEFDIQKSNFISKQKKILPKISIIILILAVSIILSLYIKSKQTYTLEVLTQQEDQNFIGRKNEIQKLYNLIAKQNVVLISGPKGVGKTTFLNYFFKKNNIDKVYWANANVNDNFYNLYLKIALDYQLIDRPVSKEMTLQRVSDFNKKTSDIYIVVYNVENTKQVESYLNNTIRGAKLIIISTNSGLKRTVWGKNSFIDIYPFHRQESLEYLRKRENLLNSFDKNSIIDKVGNLPKNLEIFIKKLENNPFYTIENCDVQDSDVLKKSFDSLIQKHGSKVIELFYYITLLGKVEIQLKFLSSLMNLSNSDLYNMLVSLERASLIEIVSNNKSYIITINDNFREDLSRLITKTISNRTNQIYINNITKRINKIFPYVTEVPDQKWEEALFLFPQIEYFTKNIKLEKSEAYLSLLENIARFHYYVHSNVEIAIKILEFVVQQRKLFNTSHVGLVKALSFLGSLHETSFVENNDALKYKYQALDLLKDRNQDIKLRIMLLEDIATLLYRTDNVRKIKHGIYYLNQVIELKKSLFLNNSEELARSYDNLGCAYVRLGDIKNVDKGLKYRRQALTLLQDHKESQLVATIYNNIGWTYNKINDKTHETYYLLKKALSIVDRFYPNNKILKATIEYNLAVYFLRNKQCQSATTYFEDSLRIRENIYPANSTKIKQNKEWLEKIKKGKVECVE